MRRISKELMTILRDDRPDTTNFSNTALMYLNRQTFEHIKEELVQPNNWPRFGQSLQMFGIPIMLYHGIPIDRWELVQRGTGENIVAGNVWEDAPTDYRIYP